jgi:hypothetical protein
MLAQAILVAVSPLLRRVSAALLAASLCLAHGEVSAWTEARPAGLVTEVAVRPDGGAEVTLRIRWRVLAGRLRQFELAELPADLTLVEASASTRADVTIPLRANTIAPGRLEVSLGDEGGVRRGSVDVVIRYTTSLRATGAIQRAGPDAVVEVATVPWERGLEATELRVTVPASARRAQWISDETPGVEAQTTTELSRDVVHALRRHLPPHTRWTARVAVDPQAFPWLVSRAAQGPRAQRLEERSQRGVQLASVALASLLVLLGVAVSRRAGPSALPLSRGGRWIPVALLALGGALQPLAALGISGALPAGTLLVLLAIALRHPARAQRSLADTRARARWIEARSLDGITPPTRWRVAAIAFSAAFSALAMGAWALRGGSLAAGIAALDLSLLAMAVVALRLPKEPSDAAVLRPLLRALAPAWSHTRMARVAWRLRGSPASLGALRARVVPRPGWRMVRGLACIEVGCAWRRGAVAWQPRPYFTMRAAERSEGAEALRALATQVGSLIDEEVHGTAVLTVDFQGVQTGLLHAALRIALPSLMVRATAPATRSQLGAEDTAAGSVMFVEGA